MNLNKRSHSTEVESEELYNFMINDLIYKFRLLTLDGEESSKVIIKKKKIEDKPKIDLTPKKIKKRKMKEINDLNGETQNNTFRLKINENFDVKLKNFIPEFSTNKIALLRKKKKRQLIEHQNFTIETFILNNVLAYLKKVI